jgi:hypothetical protein
MALRTVKSSDPPCVAKVIAKSTAAVLHGADAPDGCKHLPAGVIFHEVGNFVWKDALGNSVTTVVAAVASGGVVGVFVPIAPAEIDASNGVALTVFWRK